MSFPRYEGTKEYVASPSLKSAVNAGTLVEITFPATRVLAE